MRMSSAPHSSLSSTYQQALEYLYGRINYELATTIPYESRELNLDRMRRLLAALGNPQDTLPTVHLAGTKGKGSTAAMVASMLQAGGYRVGLYTSPHLERLEERFSVNGQNCSPSELADLVARVREAVDWLDQEAPSVADRSTFFEITTAVAWLYFQQARVDVVVLEVGLGGRLDSTNVCRPIVTAITSISFDHMRQLGNTLAAIAGEKGGIIKPGVPVVSGVVAAEPAAVLRRLAAERSAPLVERERDFRSEYRPAAAGRPAEVEFHLTGGADTWWLDDLQLGMLGAHQARNAGVALAIVAQLRRQGWRLTEDACREGLARARCPARIEVLQRNPTVVLDAAHNEASTEALVETLRESLWERRRILIFAAARDKDVAAMLRRLLPHFQQVVLTQFVSNPRGMPVSALAELTADVVRTESLDSIVFETRESPGEAWRSVAPSLTADSLVCIAGSFFLAAEIRPLLSAD